MFNTLATDSNYFLLLMLTVRNLNYVRNSNVVMDYSRKKTNKGGGGVWEVDDILF